MIGSFRQRHDLPMVAPAAILTGIGRIDSDIFPTSLFRFAGQFAEKFRPRSIMNALSEAMVMGHAVDVQVFHADDPRGIDDLTTFLMSEIIPSELDPFMDSCHNFAVLASLRGTLRQLRVFPLDFRKSLFFLTEKAGVGYLFAIGERSERLQANVNANLSSKRVKSFRFTLNRKADVPLARTAPLDGTGFHLATELAMVDHPDTAKLGKRHTVIMRQRETRLGEGEAIIAVLALETREAGFFRMFSHASKECLECQINTYRYILQDLRMHHIKRGTFLFQSREGSLLLIEREAFACLLVGLLALFKQVVVEPTALFQSLVQLLLLFPGWENPVLKHFTHVSILAQTVGVSTGSRFAARPFIPLSKARGLLAADGKLNKR